VLRPLYNITYTVFNRKVYTGYKMSLHGQSRTNNQQQLSFLKRNNKGLSSLRHINLPCTFSDIRQTFLDLNIFALDPPERLLLTSQRYYLSFSDWPPRPFGSPDRCKHKRGAIPPHNAFNYSDRIHLTLRWLY